MSGFHTHVHHKHTAKKSYAHHMCTVYTGTHLAHLCLSPQCPCKFFNFFFLLEVLELLIISSGWERGHQEVGDTLGRESALQRLAMESPWEAGALCQALR